MRVLVSCIRCNSCERDMHIVSNRSRVDGYVMRCIGCQKTLSVRFGSCLFDLKMPLSVIVHLVYFWVNNISHQTSSNMLGLDKKTVTKHFARWVTFYSSYLSFRKICTAKVDSGDMILGGPGKTVQVDESVVYRAKHHRGHALYRRPQWVLGVYDVERK